MLVGFDAKICPEEGSFVPCEKTVCIVPLLTSEATFIVVKLQVPVLVRVVILAVVRLEMPGLVRVVKLEVPVASIFVVLTALETERFATVPIS